ncbi:MAG: prolyl oligopeptidase family serine peptidase [Pseudomonadota bacterium]|nr:prolyl oligopeptidase family serine peptidase [Pseudomonadota bacterium]
MKLARAFVLACCAGLAVPVAAQPEPARASKPSDISPGTFFHHADISRVRLSPSGHWLAAAISGGDDRVRLAVLDMQGATAPVVVAAFSDADINSFDWVNDERLVYNIVDFKSGNREQDFGPGLYSVKRDGNERRELIYARKHLVQERKVPAVPPLDWNHLLLSIPQTGGNEVIVGQYRFSGNGDPSYVQPLRLDVVTGRTRSMAPGAPDHTFDWRFDPQGEPHVAVTYFKGQSEIFWREGESTPWRSLVKAPSDSMPMRPVYVGGDGQFFVGTNSSDFKRFDFKTGRPEKDAIVRTPGFDLTGFVVTDGASHALGVRVFTDAESTVWFDSDMKKLQQTVDAKLPGHTNSLTCRGCMKDGVLLVHSYSDQDPGSYWLYRPASDTWDPIGRARKEIDPKQMGQMDFYRIKARDGQDLPVWVTMPRGKSAAPRPAVVLVHGGPWVRGSYWGWNAQAQFLASRGYVVVEPEFRGSTGFGDAHFKRGFKQWGGTMQDDVADATRWAATKGLIDIGKVCIAGASYGGYATLMGLIRYPDLYKCGVAWIAVTDPRLLFEESWGSDSTTEGREYVFPIRIGDLKADADLLEAATPATHAADIRAPLLLAFGRDDRRVPLEHGNVMRSAMRAAGHDPEWVVYDGEGHGFQKLDHQIDFWNRVEKFLDKNLH